MLLISAGGRRNVAKDTAWWLIMLRIPQPTRWSHAEQVEQVVDARAVATAPRSTT
jgi:hypothetical protein